MPQAARITGVGFYVPEQRRTNADLERMIDTSDEWIVERSGIRERRIASPTETSSTMGTEAARNAMQSAQLAPSDIDMVIVGTCTPDGMFPATASRIQHALEVPEAAAFDVNAACVGFLVALGTATQYIAAGSARRVLVVGTETLSRIVDWTDRTTCVLFGDGAGAVVVEATPDGERGTVNSLLLRSDGKYAEILYAHGPASAQPDGLALEARIMMDGAAVFRQAVTSMADAATRALDGAGLSVKDIDICIPHQANARIISALARTLRMPEERIFVNLERYGNTSSATIPIALAEANAAGRLTPGDRVLLVAFGGGLAWGAMVLEWSGVRATVAVPATAVAATSTPGS